ncbi:MAG: hypothetical protein ACLUI3_11195 [Christensenellales bacterium]
MKAMKADYEQNGRCASEDRVIKTATESARHVRQHVEMHARIDQLKRRAQTEIDLERRRAFDEGRASGIALDIASGD